jgi:hypothetical protein
MKKILALAIVASMFAVMSTVASAAILTKPEPTTSLVIDMTSAGLVIDIPSAGVR